MKILGLDGKPLEASGKVFLPPSAGSGVDIQYNTITPDRYTVDVDNRTAFLNLGGLLDHKFFIVNMNFGGESLNKDNSAVSSDGEISEYQIYIQYVDEKDLDDSQNLGLYSVPNEISVGIFPVIFSSAANHVLDLSIALESTKGGGWDGAFGAALSITEIYNSAIISWD